MNAADLTELDRREVTLWRVVGRYDEAVARGDRDAAQRLDGGFRKRLADYEAAYRDAHAAHGAVVEQVALL